MNSQDLYTSLSEYHYEIHLLELASANQDAQVEWKLRVVPLKDNPGLRRCLTSVGGSNPTENIILNGQIMPVATNLPLLSGLSSRTGEKSSWIEIQTSSAYNR